MKSRIVSLALGFGLVLIGCSNQGAYLPRVATVQTAPSGSVILFSSEAGKDAAGPLQQLLDNASPGSIVELAGGDYYLNSQVVIRTANLTLRTRQSDSLGECQFAPSVRNCATFLPSSAFTAPYGMLHVSASGLVLDHIAFNGNRAPGLRSRDSVTNCLTNNTFGMNFLVDGGDATFTFSMVHSASVNALCGSGMVVAGPAKLVLQNNMIANNGVAWATAYQADGMTLVDPHDSLIEGNTVMNSVDVNVVFGGCRNCIIRNNQIIQAGRHSYAGMMLGRFLDVTTGVAQSSGDYTGAQVYNNQIYCGTDRGCDFGLVVGAAPWIPAGQSDRDFSITGGLVRNNTILDARWGLIIASATGLTVFDNSSIAPSVSGGFPNSCGTRDGTAYGISPQSSVNFVYNGMQDEAQSSQWYVTQNWDGCMYHPNDQGSANIQAVFNAAPLAPPPGT